MANCENCSVELPADAAFCPNCATKVTSAPPPPAAPTAPGLGSLSGLETVLQPDAQAPPETPLLEEGSEFHGRYRVLRKIGAGAMGIVYLADDRVTNRHVALKLISPALVKSPTAVQRFLREGLTARDVRHPNVIAMYDVGDDSGQLYLVMEYLEGENLRSWIHRAIQSGEDVSFETAMEIVIGILEGLKAAHEVGVVHRDLKPENIMLLGDPQQGEYRLKILDFGIARAIDTGPVTQLTSAGVATGTPLYMAPEQRTAADTVGPSADLYATTAIFYELLMGVPPEGRLGQPSKERGDTPAAVDRIIDKGLSSRPRSRYQSAQEYLGALGSMSGAPTPPEEGHKPPRPVPPPPAPERKPDRKKLWYGITAVIVILGLIGIYEDEPVPEPVPWPDPPLVPVHPDPPPPPPPPVSGQFSGTWYDQVLGVNFVHAYVEIHQSGNTIDGDIFNMQASPVGTLSGNINGTIMTYSYDALGQTGSGVGVLRSDATHMDVRVTESTTGYSEQHVLHKNHLPN